MALPQGNNSQRRALEPQEVPGLTLLEQLVSIPSFSGEEGQAAEFLVQYLQKSGWTAYRDEAGNAVGHIGQGSRHLLFLGHIDTVPGWIPVRWEQGYLWGRGSVDAKGPLTAFIAAATQQELSDLKVTVVAAVGEETPDSPGARHLARQKAPDLCIVGEPSGVSAITIGYKGAMVAKARLSKPGGHSAGAEASAAEQGVDLWKQVQHLCLQRGDPESHFFSVTPSLKNLITWSDGLADYAELEISLRLPPGFDPGEFQQQLWQLHPRANWAFSGYQPAYKAEKRNSLIAAFLSSLRHQGLNPVFKVKTGTADMNLVGPAWGCPVVAYGPGDSSLDHAPDERLHREEFLEAVKVLRSLLARLSA